MLVSWYKTIQCVSVAMIHYLQSWLKHIPNQHNIRDETKENDKPISHISHHKLVRLHFVAIQTLQNGGDTHLLQLDFLTLNTSAI